MHILALADEPDSRLWDLRDREKLSTADLILSAGDLSPHYLSFLTCFTHAPVVYVPGNHDSRYRTEPPEGCFCVDGDLQVFEGVRVLGLGGSMRYKPGEDMYTEEEMEKRIRRLRLKLWKYKGFDILLTHAPAQGLGDQQDLAHQGFSCFLDLMNAYHPSAMVHGHVHKEYTSRFLRERDYQGVRVINANKSFEFEILNREEGKP